MSEVGAWIRGLWDFQDPAESERRLIAAHTDEPDPQRRLVLQTQIARALGLQRRFKEAAALLGEVEAQQGALDPAGRVYFHLERGRVFNSSGRKEAARSEFIVALESAEATNLDDLAVDAAHMLGIAEANPAAQLEWNLKAIEMAEASEDAGARGWLASLLNNTAWSLHDLGRYEEALRLFQQAVQLREAQGAARPLFIARWSVGRCLRSLGRVDEARTIQGEVLREMLAAGEPDGYVYEELAELAILGGEDPAPFASRAAELLAADPWLSDAEPERIERLRQIGRSS